MIKLKCPFCQQELECCGTYIDGTKKLWCDNCGLFGDNRLFEKLADTKKKLDIAINAMESAKDTLVIDCVIRGIQAKEHESYITLRKAIERINEIKGGK
ncbi:MAG: hypothetical protein IKY15_01730 [Clostridia bacterium]|nr:hypothetical protein [Clostridia bacterium]